MDTVLKVLLCCISCLLLFSIQPAVSQTIVDPSLCSSFQQRCGRPDGPNTEKYCCAESNGGLTLYRCCNSYIGLIVGLCVGVPVIILIIVGVIVVYCFCVHYQSRKMQRLVVAQRHRRRETRNDAPRDQDPPQSKTRLSEPKYSNQEKINIMKTQGSEDNTQQGRDSKSAKQQSITKHEKGFLQKLKDVFWKDEEKEPKVEEILDKDKHKMS